MWEIEDTADELVRSCPALRSVCPAFSDYKSEARRKEKLAVYALLYAMTGDTDAIIGHNKDGKPMLDGYEISVSHTRGYAAVILSEAKNVAVDIEYYSNRVEKVESKYVREDEDNSSTEALLIIWSAKETVYKYFSGQDLQYFQMRVSPFHISQSGMLTVANLKNPQSIDVHYLLNDKYILTYACEL